MNHVAAKELIDIAMVEDYVSRRRELDRWTRRWVVTMHIEFHHDGTAPIEAIYPIAYEKLIAKAQEGLADSDNKGVVSFGHAADPFGKIVPNQLALEIHFLTNTPREIPRDD